MPLSLVKTFKPGLFGKFLLLMIATGAMISIMIGLYWRHVAQPRYRHEFHGHIEHYQQLLARDLGNPPDEKKAIAIAERLRIGLRYESADETEENWQTALFPQSFEEKNVNTIRRGQALSAVQVPGGRLLIHMRFRQEIEIVHIAAVVGIVSLALFIAWLISRYLLRPVRELRSGMAAIEAGHLDLRLESSGDDELAELKRNFNSMTQNLETMLRDRDRLLADVSHELRSPLTRMKLALEFNKDKKAVKVLRVEITEMQKIIAALLDTERLAGKQNAELVPVKDLVAALCREKKIRVHAGPTHAQIRGSAEKLKIALRNVIDNASRHGAAPVSVWLEESFDSVTITVADSGAGIPESEREKIFQPFYRSPGAAKGGYGLGLYMTMKIITSMRGRIGIKPSTRGAQVEIWLPTV